MKRSLGRILDRLAFWNLPHPITSYRFWLEHQNYSVGNLEVWRVPSVAEKATVLFCHGNAGNLRFPLARGERLAALHHAGAALWCFDYRGYGKSAGCPSERGVYEDAEAVYRFVRTHAHPEIPFILMGRSLGGAVATYLAAEVRRPDLLILESTFTSAPDVCAQWTGRKVANLMSYRFPSSERIGGVGCPVCFIHGTTDRVVPYRLGRKLYSLSPSACEFMTVEGAGHNNLHRVAGSKYKETLSRWLQLPESP